MKQKMKVIASIPTLALLLAACSSQETAIGMDPIYGKHGGGGCEGGYFYASDERCYPTGTDIPAYSPGDGRDGRYQAG